MEIKFLRKDKICCRLNKKRKEHINMELNIHSINIRERIEEYKKMETSYRKNEQH